MLDIKATCSRLVKFVYSFFLSQTLYISSMKPSVSTSSFLNSSYMEYNVMRHLKKEKINKKKKGRIDSVL